MLAPSGVTVNASDATRVLRVKCNVTELQQFCLSAVFLRATTSGIRIRLHLTTVCLSVNCFLCMSSCPVMPCERPGVVFLQLRLSALRHLRFCSSECLKISDIRIS